MIRLKAIVAAATLVAAIGAVSASQAHEGLSRSASERPTAEVSGKPGPAQASVRRAAEPVVDPERLILKAFGIDTNRRVRTIDRVMLFSQDLKRLWKSAEKRNEDEDIREGVWESTIFTNDARPTQVTKILAMKTQYDAATPPQTATVDVRARFLNAELMTDQSFTRSSRFVLVKEQNQWKIDNVVFVDQKLRKHVKTGQVLPNDMKSILR